MTIGYVKRKSIQLSELAQLYVNELAKYKKLVAEIMKNHFHNS